jgi:rubrerythrin
VYKEGIIMDEKKIEALKSAIEMEEEGKRFYLQSAEKSQNLLAKRIFQELAREEDMHIKKIWEVYRKLEEEKTLGEWITSVGALPRLQKVFQEALIEKASASSDDLEALRFALDMEDESIKYYQGLARETSDPQEKRFYLTLSYEEHGHYLTILDSIEYLTDPVGWLQLQEKGGLDGA